MTGFNNDFYVSVVGRGLFGSLEAQLETHLQSLGYAGSLETMVFDWLGDQGFNDAAGYNTLQERVTAWFVSNSVDAGS